MRTRERDAETVHQSIEVLFRLTEDARLYREMASIAGVPLTRSPAIVLDHIRERGPVRLSELAEFTDLDKSTLSRHVRRLEQSGLVEREADPEDGRATLLRVSDLGVKVGDRLRETWGALLGTALDGFTATELRQLSGLLARLAAAVEPTARESSHSAR